MTTARGDAVSCVRDSVTDHDCRRPDSGPSGFSVCRPFGAPHEPFASSAVRPFPAFEASDSDTAVVFEPDDRSCAEPRTPPVSLTTTGRPSGFVTLRDAVFAGCVVWAPPQPAAASTSMTKRNGRLIAPDAGATTCRPPRTPSP